MSKKIFLFSVNLILMLFLFVSVGAEDAGILLDDCVDLSVAHSHSEGLYPSVIDEESKAAYESDFSVIMRSGLTAEWLVYELSDGTYPVFEAYFRQNEEISHFTFEESDDGLDWKAVTPQIKIKSVESYKWIPVSYTLKAMDEKSKYVKITFSDKNAVEWSPMLAGVYLQYRNASHDGFADCVGTPYEEAVSLLKNLGFVNGYNQFEYRPYNNITRAEFAAVNASLLNVGEGVSERVFNDLPTEHWASGAVAALYRQGVINGDGNNMFNPDSNVSYAEAAKMLVCSLGYTIPAEDDGGYPSGYIAVAERLGLFEELTIADINAPLCRGDMAVMLCNAAQEEVLSQTGFGDNSIFEKSGNIFSVYSGIYETEGVIDAVGARSLIGDISVSNGDVLVGDEVYTVSDFDMSELLGCQCTIYYDYDTKKILYAKPEYKRLVDISSDKFLRLKDNKIYYESDNEYENYVSVTPNTRIIYNGRYYSRAGVIEALELKSGSMRLICNENSTADVILINEYKEYIAANDGVLSSGFNDKLTGGVKIDFGKYDFSEVTVCGEKAVPEEGYFSEGDVISIAESADKKVIYAEVSQNRVSGIVDLLDRTDCEIKIDDEIYKYSNECRWLGDEIKAGSEVVLYYDVSGIVFAVEVRGRSEYAYLMATAKDDVFGDRVSLKLMMPNGKIEIKELTEKTNVNGNRNSIKSAAALEPQLVRVSVNAENKVSELYTADSGALTESFAADSVKYYGGALSVFASKYQLSGETPIFFIPQSGEDDEYKVLSKNSLFSDFNYNLKIYDLSDEFVAGAAVIYEEGSRMRAVDSYDEAAIIRSVSQINDAEGRPCLMLSVYIRGEEREIYFDNEGGIDNTDGWISEYTPRNTTDGNNPFEVGEVIQYYSDEESHCRSFRMMLTDQMTDNSLFYEKNTGDFGVLSNENYYSELYTAYARVEYRFADKLLISCRGGVLRTVPTGSAKVYIYDRNRGFVEKATTDSIMQGAEVFVRMQYGETADILVIE